MAIFKYKMCGGDLNVVDGITVAECEYCGTRQTVSCSDDEKRINLYNRANRLRINGEFDKAANIYESIVAEFPEEAEAYWGLVICNYGIEYVDDPATGKKMPTCHRASFESIQKDENYQLALEYADVVAQKVYRDEAREIDRIREEILAISKNEKPYDIFICYKETDDKGERTIDSVIAQDVYDVLTDKGYKVFFSRISLEDKLGRQYEPYIFAALNSAKIMLSFGTKYEYFHAVWVKNEWSRFLKLMHADKSKVLIPCYKDMDAYDLPEEFKALQAQDMGKVGAVQDLVRGIGKIIEPPASVTNSGKKGEINPATEPLLKRAFMFLADGDFKSADQYCEKVLDIDPECAKAYLGKLMLEQKVRNQEQLADVADPFYNSDNYQKILRFASEDLAETIKGYNDTINARKQKGEFQNKYDNALKIMERAQTVADYIRAKEILDTIADFNNSNELRAQCQEKIDYLNKESEYNTATMLLKNSRSIEDIKKAQSILSKISYFKDAKQLIDVDCKTLKRVYELGELFKLLINESKNAVLVEDLAKQIEALNQEKEKLSQLALNFDSQYQEIKDIDQTIKSYEEMLQGSKEENTLFKFKRKSADIDYQNEIEVLNAKKSTVRNKIGVYNSVEDINKKITYIDNQIKEIEQKKSDIVTIKVDETMDSVSKILDSEQMRPFVLRTPYAAYLNKINIIHIFASANVGDVVNFGNYQGTDIPWLVLEKTASKMLLLSADCLDCMSYNNWFGDVTWDKSTLRSYLNFDFYKEAFSNVERASISETTVSPTKNPNYSSAINLDTQDKLFLLSVEELEKYLPQPSDKKAEVTAHLKHKLPFDSDKCRWWLRTTGEKNSQITYVDADGIIGYEGDIATTQYNAIRPAKWIKSGEL